MAKEKPAAKAKEQPRKLSAAEKAGSKALTDGTRVVLPAGSTPDYGPYTAVIDPKADDHIRPGG